MHMQSLADPSCVSIEDLFTCKQHQGHVIGGSKCCADRQNEAMLHLDC